MASKDTEIRKLTPGLTNQLIQILDDYNGWEKLMTSITQDYLDNENTNYRYTSEDVRIIENASLQQRRSCTEIFLEEWGTSGKNRPTVETLYQYLIKAELFRAADFVAEKLLNVPKPERPKEGPARQITLNSRPVVSHITDSLPSICEKNTVMCDDLDIECFGPSKDTMIFQYDEQFTSSEQKKNGNEPPTLDLRLFKIEDENLIRVEYKVLKMATNNFDKNLKLGGGAFGSVFYGEKNGKQYAIKVLNVYESEQNLLLHFKNELMIFSRCLNHPNILPLLAVSDDNVPCLVYEYMPNGSLECRLAMKNKKFSALTWEKRIKIVDNVTKGLMYLHTAFENPIIHRDIKTSNILLDSEDVAKIGDFGLVREKKSFLTSSTRLVLGTSAYMAPEAYEGTISTKMDIFSYGVVLMELLTGLPVFDEDREERALINFIDDVVDNDEDIHKFLDEKAGTWDSNVINELYNLAKNCTQARKKQRPEITQVNSAVEQLKQFIFKN